MSDYKDASESLLVASPRSTRPSSGSLCCNAVPHGTHSYVLERIALLAHRTRLCPTVPPSPKLLWGCPAGLDIFSASLPRACYAFWQTTLAFTRDLTLDRSGEVSGWTCLTCVLPRALWEGLCRRNPSRPPPCRKALPPLCPGGSCSTRLTLSAHASLQPFLFLEYILLAMEYVADFYLW